MSVNGNISKAWPDDIHRNNLYETKRKENRIFVAWMVAKTKPQKRVVNEAKNKGRECKKEESNCMQHSLLSE